MSQNQFTHVLDLWLNNEYNEYKYWTEVGEEILEGNEGDRDAAIGEMAEQMEVHFQGEPESMLGGYWLDLMICALAEVDWKDIASGFVPE